MFEKNDDYYMREALKEARIAFDNGETPIGAVIVHNTRIIGRAHNQMETLKDATAHAEMIAITQASMALGDWRLEGCSVYVTAEPCIMCYGALLLSRIEKICYGADDDRGWGMRGLFHPGLEPLLRKVTVIRGVLKEESRLLLSEFFRYIRIKKMSDKNTSR